jgi:hypothetical protein
MTDTRISTPTMHGHIKAGRALPLLPEGVPGPVQYAARWWAIPAGGQDYRPVTDPAVSGFLDTETQRLHQARQTARAGAERDDGRR